MNQLAPKSALHKAALQWAKAGFYCFPCREGRKEPAIENNLELATLDVAQIDAWWTENPNYNVGCAPHKSGHSVLDVDGARGLDTLTAREAKNGPLPPTLTISTPRAPGLHKWFKGECATSVGTDKNGLGPKLDTRGEGGYVLLPPSVIAQGEYKNNPAGGSYAFHDKRRPAPLPGWISGRLTAERSYQVAGTDKLDTPQNIARVRTRLKHLVEARDVAIEGRGGDDRTYRLCCEVLDLGVSRDTALALICEIWNPACEPPWAEDEIEAKLENAAEYRQNEIGAYAVGDPLTVFAHLMQPATDLPAAPAERTERAETSPYNYSLRDAEADAKRPPITYRDTARLWPDSPGGTVTQTIAGPKKHKTTFILSETFRLYKSGAARVLIVPLEGQYGVTTQRIPSLAEYYGVELSALRGRFHVANLPGFALDNSESVDAFIQFANRGGAEFGFGGFTDVVIDTQHRAAGGLEENSATDARILWNAVERIRNGITHDGGRLCNLALLHHTGKDEAKGGRGSSADLASVDQQIALHFDRDSMTVAAKVTARKDGEDGLHVGFKIVPVGANQVPILVPLSADEYREITHADDPYANHMIGGALRAAGAISPKCAVKSAVLAVALLRLWGELPKDEAAQEMKARSVSNRLSEKIKKGCYRGYLLNAGGNPVKPYAWYLPDGEDE